MELTHSSQNRFLSFAFVVLTIISFIDFAPFQTTSLEALDPTTVRTVSLNHILLFLLILLVFFMIGVRRHGVKILVLPPLFICLFLFWALLSVTWSLAPGISAYKLTKTVIVVLAIFSSQKALGSERTIALIWMVMAIILIANLVSVFVIPEARHLPGDGADALEGNWRGIFSHKNIAGAFTTLSSFFFLEFALNRRRFLDWGLFFGSLIFLAGTQCKSAEILIGPVIFLGLVYRFTRQNEFARNIFRLSFFLLAAVSIAAVVYNFDSIHDAIYDVNTFTGRGLIWQIVIDYSSRNPFLGAGFGAFWQIGPQTPVLRYSTDVFIINLPHSHNGYLEMLVTTGTIGLSLTVISLVILPILRLLRSAPEYAGLLFMIVFFSVLLNLTEPLFFQSNKGAWFINLIAISLIYNSQTFKRRENNRHRARLDTVN